MDREVLLAEGDDPLPQAFLLARWPALAGGGEEGAVGLASELVDEDAEAARRVAEASGGLGGWEALDEGGSEGLVLAVFGQARLEEKAFGFCY